MCKVKLARDRTIGRRDTTQVQSMYSSSSWNGVLLCADNTQGSRWAGGRGRCRRHCLYPAGVRWCKSSMRSKLSRIELLRRINMSLLWDSHAKEVELAFWSISFKLLRTSGRQKYGRECYLLPTHLLKKTKKCDFKYFNKIK
jgi:hypothetical protein